MIYVYYIELPYTVRAFTMPCDDGYCIYINSRLTHEQQREAYEHEKLHIDRNDFAKESVSEVELSATDIHL